MRLIRANTGCIKKNAILVSNANILNNLISKLICLHLFLSLAIKLFDKGLLPKFDPYVFEKFYVKCKWLERQIFEMQMKFYVERNLPIWSTRCEKRFVLKPSMKAKYLRLSTFILFFQFYMHYKRTI